MDSAKLVLALLDEAYEKKTWHGPNLKQSIKGITAKQAAWRPRPGRHNIWEVTLHAAYWKYAVRRRIEGGKRGSFALKGSNFFTRPEKGNLNEAAWSADKKLLGVSIIGENATELIHVGLVVLDKGLPIDEFIEQVFNYPTLSETYKYAAYDGLGNLAGHKLREG